MSKNNSIPNFLDLDKESPLKDLEGLPLGLKDQEDDGAIEISDTYANGGHYSWGHEFDTNFQNEKELLDKYDEMAMEPYMRDAIADIIDQCIVQEDNTQVVTLNLDYVDNKFVNDSVKTKIQEEFNYLITLLDFNNRGYDLFSDWFINGKQYHFAKLNDSNDSIEDVLQLDQRNVQKVRKVNKKRVKNSQGELVSVVADTEQFFLYKLNNRDNSNKFKSFHMDVENAVKFPHDSIIHIHSGNVDKKNNLILSDIHPAIRTYNQLKQTEDAMVIYRLVRAPEKRVFYIDVGNMNRNAGDKYISSFIQKFKTKQQYNTQTGKLSTGSKNIQSLFEDWWIPRKGTQNSEVTTLDSAQQLGETDELELLKRKLYTSMRIPRTRLDPESAYSLGRAAEITRDEIKFEKYAKRLRRKFSKLFIELLKMQLNLKNIMTFEQFAEIQNNILIDWAKDNYYEELKKGELLGERLRILADMKDEIGTFFDYEYVHREVLMRSNEETEKWLKKYPEPTKEELSVDNDDEF